MNILILTEYFPASEKADITGGVEARAYNVAKRLSRKHNVKIISSWRKGLKRKEDFGKIKVYRVGPNHEYSHSAGYLSRSRFVKAAIKFGSKLKNIDIVDGYNFTTYLPAYRIAKKLGKKSIATYHETWIGKWLKNNGIITGIPYEIMERYLIKLKYDKIISVSDFTKKKLVEKGVKKNKIEVIPNGVDLSEFRKIKTEKENKKIICCINRLTKNKRVSDIIKAISLVKQEFPSIKLKIIGKGPEMKKLKKLVKILDLQKNTEFFGFVKKNEDVIKILKSSDIFCSASVVEGFGMVVVEAMAANIPYICSDIEPFKEITENGKGGLIFKQKDYLDLAKKITLLLKDKKLYSKKKKEEEKLVEKYDWNVIIKRIEKTYEKTIKQS